MRFSQTIVAEKRRIMALETGTMDLVMARMIFFTVLILPKSLRNASPPRRHRGRTHCGIGLRGSFFASQAHAAEGPIWFTLPSVCAGSRNPIVFDVSVSSSSFCAKKTKKERETETEAKRRREGEGERVGKGRGGEGERGRGGARGRGKNEKGEELERDRET